MRRAFEITGTLLLTLACGALAWVCLSGWAPAAALADFEGLPPFNYLAAADDLRGQQRFAEAAMVADAGLLSVPETAQAALRAERTQIDIERSRGARSGEPTRDTLDLYRHVGDDDTRRKAEAVAQRPGGAFALWIGQNSATVWLKMGGVEREPWLVRAGTKGRAGVDFLLDRGALLLERRPLAERVGRLYADRPPPALEHVLARRSEVICGLVCAALLYLVIVLLAEVAVARGERREKGIKLVARV